MIEVGLVVVVVVVQIGVPGGGEDIGEGSNSPQEAGGLSSGSRCPGSLSGEH